MKTNFTKMTYPLSILGLALGLTALSTLSHAEGRDPAQFRAAFHQCAEKLEITLPEKGTGQRPNLSDDQRQQMHACLSEAGVKPPRHHHKRSPERVAQLQACFKSDDVAFPARGEKRTDDQKAEFKKCRTELKGAVAQS